MSLSLAFMQDKICQMWHIVNMQVNQQMFWHNEKGKTRPNTQELILPKLSIITATYNADDTLDIADSYNVAMLISEPYPWTLYAKPLREIGQWFLNREF